MPDDELIAFSADLHSDLRYEADIEGAEAMLPEVFTRRVVEILIDEGEAEELVDCYHLNDTVRPAVEVSGYGIDDGDTLNLVATIYGGSDPENVTRADIQRAVRRARAFWNRCRDRAYHDELEESSDAWDMALQIHRAAPAINRVQIFVATDGLARVEWIDPEDADDIEYRYSVWDLNRMLRYETSGRKSDPIEVNFVARFGEALPVLEAPRHTDEFRAFVAIIPGHILAEIYDEYGARLLERNVRSFLQFTGKVNAGMRDTLNEHPERFLAFNNGISATASDVTLTRLDEGGQGLAVVSDLQIVNGGQTTASVHRAVRLGIPVDRVGVQAKITVVQGELMDALVPRISEYANSQNKVQLADLSSNVPIHIAMESLSRSIWAPATAETGRQTKWFYERARGQYADSRSREPTRARQRSFQEQHPPRQRFTKVELATFENTWDQHPHRVSEGAQKNFGFFMAQINRRGPEFRPDAAYFRAAVAKCILFRRAEKLVTEQRFGGYRRNIVAYAIARLSLATDRLLDLDRIWTQQATDEQVDGALVELAHLAFTVLTDDRRPSRNVTEWAKKEECWAQMRRTRWAVPAAIAAAITSPANATREVGHAGGAESGMGGDALGPAFDGDQFLAIHEWSKQTDSLTGWQRRLAFTLGTSLKGGKLVMPRQIPHAQKLLEDASAAGFDTSRL